MEAEGVRVQLEESRQQLVQAYQLLQGDPDNEQLLSLVQDLKEVIAALKESLQDERGVDKESEDDEDEDIFGEAVVDTTGATTSGATPRKRKLEVNEDEGAGKRIRPEESSSALQHRQQTEEEEEEEAAPDLVDLRNVEVEVEGHLPKDCPVTTFAASGLSSPILTNIHRAGFRAPTPVQAYALPLVQAKRDVMVQAKTGSGKTAAYLLPVIDRLILEPPKRPLQYYKHFPFFLVLVPTRELAVQIHEEARKFTWGTEITAAVLYGGASFEQQAQLVAEGCDILVATPGRLLDMIDRGKIGLSCVQYLCFDEADRMLDMGFEKEMQSIVENKDMPPSTKRQTIMFSATFPKTIKRFAGKFMRTFTFVKIGKTGLTSSITQIIKWVEHRNKKSQIMKELEAAGDHLVLVFVETKKDCEQLSWFLQNKGFNVESIHGNRSQQERETALETFRSGQTPILIATAVVARGLDIEHVGHVINYDLPKSIEDYIHRIGRTGRADKVGVSTSFYNEQNLKLAPQLTKVLQKCGQNIPEWLQKTTS